MEALKEPAQGRALPPARRVVLRPLEGRTPSPGGSVRLAIKSRTAANIVHSPATEKNGH